MRKIEESGRFIAHWLHFEAIYLHSMVIAHTFSDIIYIMEHWVDLQLTVHFEDGTLHFVECYVV